MREVELDATVAALGSLHLAQKELFDTVDELRSLGVGEIVDLPQIVVCGDQSSGKSSVLEAISRIRFPVKTDICTRFATELILRTQATASVNVSIEWQNTDKADGKPREEKLRGPDGGKRGIPEIIEEARKLMGVDGSKKTVSTDVLRICVSAPDVPNLTLVDLPGFYYGSGGGQNYDDRLVVDELARRYLSRGNTIILAVVGARSSINQQKVLDEARAVDPRRERTLGVITQLDKLEPGTETNRYIELATGSNEKTRLKYAWHLVRNRSEKEASTSNDERDATESVFLSSGPWSSIPEEDKGIRSLRSKLSNILSVHISKSLPSVVEDMKRCVADRAAKLARLGKPRSDPRQLKEYLVNAADEFGRLAREAVQGSYMDNFFFDGLDSRSDIEDQSDGDPLNQRVRKLRALIRDLNRVFVTMMLKKGQGRQIEWEDGDPMQNGEVAAVPEYLTGVAERYQIEEPRPVQEHDLKLEMDRFAAQNQGCDFPGGPNYGATLQFFQGLSTPWRQIAETHAKLATDVCHTFSKELLGYVFGADEETCERLLVEYVDPYFEAKREAMGVKLQELLPRRVGYAIAHEHEFELRSSRRHENRIVRQVERLEEREAARGVVPDLSPRGKKAMLDGGNLAQVQYYADRLVRRHQGFTLASAERMIDNLVVYYEISRRTFIENVVILAIENELVCEIPKILAAGKFAGMDDDAILELAAESPHIQQIRAKLVDELERLRQGIALCEAHSRRKRAPLGLEMGLKMDKPAAFRRSLGATVEDVD
ncbi:P-loop containing nucleoside triphosphate hydrolase protein [Podospora aff. communis PSN243]|uniref:P-loop containing nucleoside triphosphate hydrolase protein n=1 Tax=Podospora aff. communis PSN243 TaxID=3040156 RepID=A0AAV9H5A1_9PEZI|nr:P-loop containing nucleoside triphosphate hydrolase protein [Podospora aff. communis PSN243]